LVHRKSEHFKKLLVTTLVELTLPNLLLDLLRLSLWLKESGTEELGCIVLPCESHNLPHNLSGSKLRKKPIH
jgi:hypothetical protein